ncbi:glycerophosphodiester phosphodiesterase, partial [Nocardiopsis sp. NPDC006832]
MTLSIALRGDTARYPGNTLPALRSALRGGVDLVKIDVHL